MDINFDISVNDASNWCFITGMGANGTTGLTKILNNHPDICIIQEGGLWGYLELLNCSSIDVSSLCNIHSHNIMNHRINYFHSVNYNLKNKNEECNYLNFKYHKDLIWSAKGLREIMEGFRNAIAPDNFIFGDKYIDYGTNIETVNKIFPHFKNLLTIRNIWDHISSIRNCQCFNQVYTGMNSNQLIKKAVFLGLYSKIYENQIVRYKKNVAYKVYFKDLAFNTKEIISKILDFLEVEKDYMDWSVLDNVYYKESMYRWKNDKEVIKVKNYISKNFCLEKLDDINLYSEEELMKKRDMVMNLLEDYQG